MPRRSPSCRRLPCRGRRADSGRPGRYGARASPLGFARAAALTEPQAPLDAVYEAARANTRLRGVKRSARKARTALHDLPAAQGLLHLKRGDRLHLTADGLGQDAAVAGGAAAPAHIACTLPQALRCLRKGERIWFDDGRIGGVVRRRLRGRVEVEITHARDGGERLAADKGINLPDTALDLPALTEKDLEDLEVVARHADLVGLSFRRSADDVRALRRRLLELDAGHLGMLL